MACNKEESTELLYPIEINIKIKGINRRFTGETALIYLSENLPLLEDLGRSTTCATRGTQGTVEVEVIVRDISEEQFRVTEMKHNKQLKA